MMNKANLLMLLFLFSVAGARAEVATIDTATIVEKTLACVDCPDWKIVGVCFWLRCSLWDCEVKESPKIHQNLPDLVVATHTTSTSPLVDSLTINNVNAANLTNKDESPFELETYVDYKHAEVLGNPAVVFFNALHEADDEYFCKSGVQVPYFPYFLSGLDSAWSDPDVEVFLGSIFGIIRAPKITTNWPLGYWANVYPRCGWGSHPYDAINGAVAAHRAAAVTTSNFAPHIYIQPSTDCGNRCWPPKPVEENNANNHQFQMIFPDAATNSRVMGGSATWANGKNINGDEGYAWTLWRPYECCKKKGSFLFSVDW